MSCIKHTMVDFLCFALMNKIEDCSNMRKTETKFNVCMQN